MVKAMQNSKQPKQSGEIKKTGKTTIPQALSLITQIGINMTVTVGGCILLGKYLDDFFSTSPWLLLVFTVLGVLAAFRNLFHMTKGR